MARRYDSGTTTFSPEGRLYQVEYAVGAINNAAASVGILSPQGIVIAAEKKVASKLLAPPRSSEKMLKIDAHILASVAGLTADAAILVQQARLIAQRHQYSYGEPMPLEQMVTILADYKHSYTQYGGLRPFGCAFLFGGWDRHRGFSLMQSDPSGNFSGWKATAIGNNSATAVSSLKSEYTEGLTLADAAKLAVKVLCKALDTAHPTSERLEVACLTWAQVAEALMAPSGLAGAAAAAASSASSSTSGAAGSSAASESKEESKEEKEAKEKAIKALGRRPKGAGGELVQIFLTTGQVDALIAEAVPPADDAAAPAPGGPAKASI